MPKIKQHYSKEALVFWNETVVINLYLYRLYEMLLWSTNPTHIQPNSLCGVKQDIFVHPNCLAVKIDVHKCNIKLPEKCFNCEHEKLSLMSLPTHSCKLFSEVLVQSHLTAAHSMWEVPTMFYLHGNEPLQPTCKV